MAAARPVLPILQELGLATNQVQEWMKAEGVEHIDGLAHAFRFYEHVMEEADFLLEAWLAAVSRKTEAWKRSTDFARLQQRLHASSQAIGSAHVRVPGPKRGALRPLRKFGKPKPKAIAKAAAVDAKARSQAAKAAVELSLSWAPRAGLAQGLQLSDPMIPLVREVHEERVGAFEPKGVWAAINQFRAWRAFRESKSTRDLHAELVVLLSVFIAGKTAATGPLAAWNQLDWCRRHLKAELPLDSVPKPAKKGKSDGVVRKNTQAVAMPPEFLLAYEDALERMVKAKDWRRGPVAGSLQVAYSLVRIVHLGRSAFTHVSEVSYWLEAFRGKGKRDGARRAFTWAMVRKGLSGVDVGKVLYDIWLEWSEAEGFPLGYVVMDPDSGTKMESSHIQGVMRTVAEAFIPDPLQARMVQPYSNRRFGGTLCTITKTPPTDIIDYGGWAGVPELAKVVTDSTAVLAAWKRSMPHLYSDRRSENEEIQKALHMDMLRGLILELPEEEEGHTAPATWENVQLVSMRSGDDGVPFLQAVRASAMAAVALEREGIKVLPVFGTQVALRRQFEVRAVAGKKPVRLVNLLGAAAKRARVKPAPSTPVLPEVEQEQVNPEQLPAEPPCEMPEKMWVLTKRSKYLHATSTETYRCPVTGDPLEGIFTACKWRKGVAKRVPITEGNVIWRGNRESAVGMRIIFCPAACCEP